ncbi:MAG TPA: hypothetical protein VMH30_15150 [Verrucomicrobiae bacterium]|nr:hypothetical protein [Verrucomicrobiae bacterium]
MRALTFRQLRVRRATRRLLFLILSAIAVSKYLPLKGIGLWCFSSNVTGSFSFWHAGCDRTEYEKLAHMLAQAK